MTVLAKKRQYECSIDPARTAEAREQQIRNDGFERVCEGFRMPDGNRLILPEHDMSADGTRSWRDPEDEPERINGLPARLMVLEDPPKPFRPGPDGFPSDEPMPAVLTKADIDALSARRPCK